jgi:Family of unknown function (DUF6152)
MKNFVVSLTIIFAVLLVSGPLPAHHGEANYDTTKIVSVKGTVTEFKFVNPHVEVSMDVKNDAGMIEKWIGEARSPAMLARYGGWDKNTIKIGDVITASGHRTKNGTNFLRLTTIVRADGQEMPNL